QLSDASVWMANGAGGWKQMCGGGGGTGLDDFTSDSTTSTSGAVTSVIGSYTTVADDSVATMRAVVWAQDDTSNDAQKYVIEVTIKRDNSSVVTVEAVDVLSQFEDQAPATDAVTFIVNGLDIDVTVLGIAGRGIEWRAQLYVSSIEV
ncbi:MAG: hypothetical protein QGG14_00880, partial [Planctomycetota bacterium]|nr:hypothetical protein [Planctomycetota bacterium]